MKKDNRTSGERTRDLTISLLVERLQLLKMRLKRKENSARGDANRLACAREYRHAQEYQTLNKMISETVNLAGEKHHEVGKD